MNLVHVKIIRRMSGLAIAAALALLNGCATTGNTKDPLEGYNRAMFAFNDGLDRAVVKPLAQGYVAVVPAPVRTGVSNFFGNIADVFIAVNDLLQGKLPDAASDVGRVAINTTVGLLGFIDFASDSGLEKHDEDFGQTFGRWGVGGGPYVVLPIFGPRTLRDAFAQILDSKTDPVSQLDNISARNSLWVVRGVSDRSGLLSADKIVEEAALDRYAYIRGAYLQMRRSKVYDGNPPRLTDDGAQLEENFAILLQQPEEYGNPVTFGAERPSIMALAPQVGVAPPRAAPQ